jgi:HlyD family type I secretion membrane fusion protein
VHTTGAVITPGQKLMDIVPREDRLIVEARLRPEDVDKALSGSVATVRFSAFDRDTTPELKGKVAIVSGDRLTDPNTQESYYAVRVVISTTEIARLGDLQLRVGMPAEVFIGTEKRTAISYLTRPFLDAVRRTFLDG